MTDADIQIRTAEAEDLQSIIRLIWDDEFGRDRESLAASSLPEYRAAFDAIADDPAHGPLVAVADSTVIGCLQYIIMPGLSFRGALRCLAEDFRVASDYRSRGIGARLLQAAEEHARLRGCTVMELFVHRNRTDAQRFYERAGYTGHHRGFRKTLGA